MTKSVLYLGLKAPEGVVHYPMIRIVPLNPPISYEGITHLIATSQTTLELLQPPPHLTIIAVGKKTASLTGNKTLIAQEETAEGVVEILKTIDPPSARFLYPHSSLSRPLIKEFLQKYGYHFVDVDLYTTCLQAPDPLPDLGQFEKLIFTSPSTVDAFFLAFDKIPSHIHVECIGKITKSYLTKKIDPTSV